MENFLFITLLILFLAGLYYLGVKYLPNERWQFIASIPIKKMDDNRWSAINLTFYGFFNALAYFIATALFITLSGSAGFKFDFLFTLTALILVICVPASKIVAMIVEKKKHTFTVGGAVFVGSIFSPFLVMFTVSFFYQIPLKDSIGYIVPIMSLLLASYCIGESIGRFACISFGCCYGKAVSTLSPLWRKVFSKFNTVFYGGTKKVAYESHLEGEALVPTQLMATINFGFAGVAGIILFLTGHYIISFIVTIIFSQGYRVLSEFFRKDYRGEKKFSYYQRMAIFVIAYSFLIAIFTYDSSYTFNFNIVSGLKELITLKSFILLEFIFLFIFLYNGTSRVTKSSINFDVVKENI